MGRSFHNKFLRVNLTDGSIKVEEPGIPYLRRYLGGWNVVADVLLREVPAGADPLGPQNKMVFTAGVAAGLPLSGAARSAVGAKSPLTGGFGVGEVGGFWAVELKRAGWDAIIVEGVSPKPVYLWIKDDQVELRDASSLWGLETRETVEALKAETGEKRLHAAMIGPGGENLVRYAAIMHGLFDAVGRTGMGAVMGSKKLKAIAVRGSKPVEAADPDKIRALAQEMARGVNDGTKAAMFHAYGTGRELNSGLISGNLPVKNFDEGEFEGVDNLSAQNFMEGPLGDGMDACFACAVRCKKRVKGGAYSLDPNYGGPEYEALGSLGSTCGVNDIEAVCKANEICNANSLDVISCGVAIAWAMEAFEKGILTLEDTGGIDLRFGNADALVRVTGMIARREGIGDLLAEGVKRASEKVGKGSEFFAVHAKGQEYPMHEPRLKRGMAIGYAISPTGADHMHSLHDQGLVNSGEDGLQAMGDLRALGVLDPVPLEDLGPAKARATMYNSMIAVADNCMTMCAFVPWTLEETTAILNAATGWDISTYELIKVGERALTLARVFNMREGFTAADDKLAPRSSQPTVNGALANAGIDPEELNETMQFTYELMGWDRETGVPTEGKLYELDVGWAAKYLPKNR